MALSAKNPFMNQIIVGRRIAFGASEIKPIVNIPQDALRVKVKLRHNKPVVAYVKFADRIESWLLSDGPEWRLWLVQGANFAKLP